MPVAQVRQKACLEGKLRPGGRGPPQPTQQACIKAGTRIQTSWEDASPVPSHPCPSKRPGRGSLGLSFFPCRMGLAMLGVDGAAVAEWPPPGPPNPVGTTLPVWLQLSRPLAPAGRKRLWRPLQASPSLPKIAPLLVMHTPARSG